jgi:hypothetical protein
MSHAVLAVILPVGQDATEEYLNSRMEPYSENLEVPEYDEPCYCIGGKARRAAEVATNAKFGTIDDVREAFWATHGKDSEEVQKREWESLTDPRWQFEKKCFDNHPDKAKADPECKVCHGTGTLKSTRNPKAKWDWWVVGGRWPGFIEGKDIGPVSALLAEDPPFAIMTPDGEWHEKGELGWWGSVSDEDAEWSTKGRSILEQYRDHTAVIVDYHI